MDSSKTVERNPLLLRLDPANETAMRHLIGGALRTQAIYALARFGMPDHLAAGPLTAAEVASKSATAVEPTARLLRYLARWGVLAESADGRFALTPVGEYLQSGHPRSLRSSAIRAGEGFWKTVSALRNALENDITPHEIVHGATFFERIGAESSEGEFAARMRSSTRGLADEIVASGALPEGRLIVDVGGGDGALLTALLERQPSSRGIVFDQPPMVERVRERLSSDIADRCELVAGSFFDEVPRGDVYVLSWILHDWPDEQARLILRRCRESAAQSASLLLLEIELPPLGQNGAVAEASFDPFEVDLQMLLLTGGKERTREEYAALLAAEGFALREVLAIRSMRGVSLFRAERVS